MKQLLAAVILFLLAAPASAGEFSSPLPSDLPSSLVLRAFPTAEGFGAAASGGRGGSVCHVTNLNDSGSGSLRNCLETESGARTVVFDISGYIDLSSNIVCDGTSCGTLTIAGQTAPGEGVCLRGGTIDLRSAPDIIIRHMCFRRGDQPGETRSLSDGLRLVSGITDAIVDHVSISWSHDEAIEISGASTARITVQNSLIAEPLNGDIGGETNHGYGPMVFLRSEGVTWYRILIAHALRRSPRVADVDDIDIYNIIVYDWGQVGTYIVDSGGVEPETFATVNVQNNVYRAGTDSAGGTHIQCADGTGGNAQLGQIHVDGNEDDAGADADTIDNRNGECSGALAGSPFARNADAQVDLRPASHIWATLLDHVGRFPRDPIDSQAISDVLNGTGRIIDCVDLQDQGNSVVSNCQIESSYGSDYAYPSESRPVGWDSDDDGMPDHWETAHGLDPTDATDRNNTNLCGPWTNLECYINQAAGDYPSGERASGLAPFHGAVNMMGGTL